ncbi:ComF family protein [Jannaschia pohangensis]|uniref:ComF family protein n=1 Tax=Jannaschia pohangensis TaxID=390807 RepID=A0A1I3T5C1_9RHOB|nr:ComF family protein [Jannaschia pohangensis]SFJ66254.1 comF family protein [Jannaschia pohangensis]
MDTRLQRVTHRALHALREAIYPTTCMMCDNRVQDDGGLCPACWSETPFLSGACCGLCGTPLPGADDGPARCDECLTLARPWDEGRAALAYAGVGRKMVLALKHGDRTELARGGARWIQRRARDVLTPQTLFVPVPIHRWRLLKRRYNQSALLARELATLNDAPFCPLALRRHRETPSQDHRSVADRYANIAGAISIGGGPDVRGAHVALVDDVMTSGATLTVCSDILRQAGAARITILLLARVAKDR